MSVFAGVLEREAQHRSVDPRCFLAPFAPAHRRGCEGALRKVHLVEKQALARRGFDPWDERSWVWACGGPWPGLAGHHGLFDSYRLVVPAEALPVGVVEMAVELGMVPYLERRYGFQRAAYPCESGMFEATVVPS